MLKITDLKFVDTKKIVSYLLPFCFALGLIFWGCAKEKLIAFIPLPDSSNALPVVFVEDVDSLVYEVSEVLTKEGSGAKESENTSQVLLKYKGDSLGGSKTFWLIDFKMRENKGGEVKFKESLAVHFEKEENPSSEKNLSPILFYGKTTYSKNMVNSLAKSILNRSYKTILQGDFVLEKTLLKKDTILHNGANQEAWVLEAKLKYKDQIKMTSTYWYGTAGLLKGVQTWPSFESRNVKGKKTGTFKMVRSLLLQSP